MSGPFQMKSMVLIPDFAARVGPLPDIRVHVVTSARSHVHSNVPSPAHAARGGTSKGERRGSLSERIPDAVEQARGGERSDRDQEGGNEIMQHVAGDVAERGPEHGRPGHAGYLGGAGAESSRSPHARRTILKRVVPSVAAPGPCGGTECSATTTPSPSPHLPRFVPAHAANFRCTPSRSDARRNRARA